MAMIAWSNFERWCGVFVHIPSQDKKSSERGKAVNLRFQIDFRPDFQATPYTKPYTETKKGLQPKP
jgi:hypothetical protein